MKMLSYLIFTVTALLASILFSTIGFAAQLPVLCHEFINKKSNNKLFASDNPLAFYTFDEDGVFYSKNPTTGDINWTHELGGGTSSEIASDDNYIYITNTNEEPSGRQAFSVRALSKTTGIPAWQTEKFIFLRENKPNESNFPPRAFLYLRKEKDLFFVNAEGAALIDKKNGETKWKISITPQITARPVITNDILILPGDDLQLYFFRLSDGRTIKTQKMRSRVSALYADERQIVVGDQKGSIESFDRENADAHWSFKTGGEISGIVAVSDGFLITSFDNFAYQLSGENGNLLWKKRFFSRLRERPLLDSKNSIAALVDGRRAVFLDLNAKGAILSQIELAENEFFSDAPILFNGLYIFNTGSKTVIYSFNECPPRG